MSHPPKSQTRDNNNAFPTNWTRVKLFDVALVISGQHILEADHNQNGQGIGYLTGPADFGTLQPKISKWTQKPKVICEPGDILVTVKGAGVGKINYAPDDPVAIGRQLMAIRGNSNKVDIDFLYLFLSTCRAHFQEKSVGATVPGLSRGDIETLLISLPDLVKQRQIASQLKIQLAEVEKARQAAEVQLRDSLFLQTRMLETIFAKLASAPRKKIGNEAETKSGSTPSRGQKNFWEPAEIPWIKTAEVAFAPITQAEEYISKQALANCSLRLLPENTVLIAMYGQGKTRGQSAILKIEATTNQACFAILPNETWEPEFLYLWLKRSYQDLRDLSEDRGGNQANLNGTLLKAVEVPSPSKLVQKKIIHRVNSALNEIESIISASKASLSDFDILPQKILTQAFEN